MEYRDQSVSLSVCLSAIISLEHGTAGPIFTTFVVQIPCGRGSVLLWRRCDTGAECDVSECLVYHSNGWDYLSSECTVVFAMCKDDRRLVKSVPLPETSEPSWVTVDVQSAVEQWIKKPRRNFGLQVVVRDVRRRRRRREYDALGIVDGCDCDNGENSCELCIPHMECLCTS